MASRKPVRALWIPLVLASVNGVLAAQTTPVESAKDAGVAISRTTPHLSFTATLSPTVVMAGTRMSIVVDIVPKPGMHVYAPGTQYRPIAIKIAPSPFLRVHEPRYPEPARYLFKPLNEEVLVYSSRFQLVVDLTAGESEEQRVALRKHRKPTVSGDIEYQACDDRVCYLPVSIPVRWRVTVRTHR